MSVIACEGRGTVRNVIVRAKAKRCHGKFNYIFVLVIYCPHSQPKPEEIYQNHKKYVKKRKILCMYISGEIWCNKMHICKILYSVLH